MLSFIGLGLSFYVRRKAKFGGEYLNLNDRKTEKM